VKVMKSKLNHYLKLDGTIENVFDHIYAYDFVKLLQGLIK